MWLQIYNIIYFFEEEMLHMPNINALGKETGNNIYIVIPASFADQLFRQSYII